MLGLLCVGMVMNRFQEGRKQQVLVVGEVADDLREAGQRARGEGGDTPSD